MKPFAGGNAWPERGGPGLGPLDVGPMHQEEAGVTVDPNEGQGLGGGADPPPRRRDGYWLRIVALWLLKVIGALLAIGFWGAQLYFLIRAHSYNTSAPAAIATEALMWWLEYVLLLR